MKRIRAHLSLLLGAVILFVLTFALLTADVFSYQTTLPVNIEAQGGVATLQVGSQTIPLGAIATPTTFSFAPQDPVVHEYQLDGTDSTNNLSLDTIYLHQIAASPYYRFIAAMRDLDGTSRWRDLQVWADGRQIGQLAWLPNGASVALPPSTSLHISVLLQRPEAAVTLDLTSIDGSILHITLDRNSRHIMVTRTLSGVSSDLPVITVFFPTDAAPFAAMVNDTLIRTLLWALLVLFVVLVGEAVIALPRYLWFRLRQRAVSVKVAIVDVQNQDTSNTPETNHPTQADEQGGRLPFLPTVYQYVRSVWQRLTSALHPIALIALVVSLIFVAWIARVQYNGEPHIFDASAYLFAAKMYATGHLSVPLPPAVDRFPGPFMVVWNGQWFGQYVPGTALTLVPGIWLGIPWLVEPILGTLALLGIGLIAARLYHDRRVATLAVILGTLSPFYSYLAASYMSHTVALFYLVWGFWALLRFAQGKASWNMSLSAVCFGMAALTRDLVALLFASIVIAGILILSWRRLSQHQHWKRWLVPGASFVAIALLFAIGYFAFNAILTGSATVSPRQLFFAGDHWGFGQGVGFYGEHTLAAGFVNLDELLTILAIDLYGWPFYLTLAFLALPFLTRKAVGADWLMLGGVVIMVGVLVGYFYHGIYLGPRYLYETLPFLLILTARGMLTLASAGQAAGKKVGQWLSSRSVVQRAVPHIKGSIVTIVLVVGLVSCNLLYYIPRQISLYQNYSGLPTGYQIDLAAVYNPPVHNAIVVTNDFFIYQFVLFPLNDPYLHNDVLYAQAGDDSQYTELRTAFPGRKLYRLDVAADGTVGYTAL